MGSAAYIHDLAEALLASAVAGLAPSRTGHKAPGVTYVAHGAPAWDGCDQLAVWVGPITLRGVAGVAAGRSGVPTALPVAAFTIDLARCVHEPDARGNGPTAAALASDAALLNRDAWCLHTGVSRDLGDVFGGCRVIEPGEMIPLGPEGGLAGWRWPIVVSLNDGGPT